MTRLRTLTAVFLLLVLAGALGADPTLPELFKRAKDKFAAGDYKGSLADFELLDKNSAKPGFENDRAKLIPVVTFYRGANLAALGRKNEAEEAFVAYLETTPNASIASPPFPKPTVEVFELARRDAASRSTTVRTAYAAFTPPPDWFMLNDEHWIETPIRYLLTPAQRREYTSFTTNKERSDFIEAFWRQLDPTPATETNELRAEFERRVAFADSNFATPKQAGRFTERGAVFTFLGPPTYVGVTQVAVGDESIDQLRAVQTSTFIGSPELERKGTHGQRESWYYRPGRIPAGVPYPEVRFDFLTKEGYGTSVMQKDPEPMQTLGIAAEAARRDKRLN